MSAPPPSQGLRQHAAVPSDPAPELQAARGRAPATTSPRTATPTVAITKSGQSPDASLERRPSLSAYGHHRQTSIVHGIQHSRNTSFVNSPATSPLSPQIIAAVGGSGALPLNGAIAPPDEALEMPFTNGGAAASATSVDLTADRVGNDAASTTGSTRRPERVHSGKSKRDHHHRSQSRHHHQELKTVGEYALHHLFNSFVGQADQKINQVLMDQSSSEPHVEDICGPGVDPSFDQLLSALGHIARLKPKPLIDTLMFWRKAKSEAGNSSTRPEVHHQPKETAPPANGMLPRRNTEPVQTLGEQQHTVAMASSTDLNSTRLQLQAERRGSVAVYLLCRVLIEIIGQSDLACVTPEMADRLEDIIYTQLKATNQETLDISPLRHANYVIFGQLLGVMSEINFAKVTRRFTKDLETCQTHLGVKGLTTRAVEDKAVLIVGGMKYLKVKTHPEEAWEQSCDFMQALARLFAEVHGQPVKYAYSHLLKNLLLSIAANATLGFTIPKWRLVVDTIKPRLTLLLAKPKHWQEAFPLMTALLCVSPAEGFAAQWLQLALSSQPRLKERTTRVIALRAICRLVWTYIYRTSFDPPNIAIKKLEEIVKMVFQPGKRSYLSTETVIAEPLIQLIRIIGFKHQDLCFRAIIFPLMNSDQFAPGRDLRVENLEPERMVIGIRAFLAIMSDLENAQQPPFPATFENDPIDHNDLGSTPTSPRGLAQLNVPSKSTFVKEERLSRPVVVNGFGEVAKESYVKFCKILGEITIICDNAFGGQAVLDEKFSVQTPKTPMAEAFSFGRSNDYQNSPDLRQGFYDLLHVAVQALPRCLSPHIPFNSLLNLLCTGTAHVQSNIASSSAKSLKAIARQSHAQQVTIGFARFIFNFDDRYATMSDGGMLGPGHIESTLRLYVELLEIWIEEIKQKAKKAALDPPEESAAGNRGAQLDLSAVWAHVDEIESYGLFFLCSPSPRVRAFAVTVLRLITEFDTALGKDSTRVIRIMEGSPQKVIDVNDEKLSVAERSRLQRGMRKSNLQSTLIELCGSDAPYDSTLWFKVFPNLIRISHEICPFAVTLTRDIVCARLSQMHRTITSVAEGPRHSPYPGMDVGKLGGRLAATAPEVVVEQWKLYLIFACTTLTNVGAQKVTPSAGSQHSRKSSKSSQKSHNKVHSAADLFSTVLHFLSAPNPAIRDAVVIGLGSININLYRTLLDCLQVHVATCAEEAKSRLGTHQRTISSPRRNRRTDYLRTEVTHVYKLTSHFLRQDQAYNDEWILNNLVTYTKDLRLFLSDAEVQNEWDFQKLRTHYCGLIEALFEGINKTKDPLRWMPFQARKAAFALMEDWCGYSPNQIQIRQREDSMRRSILDREQDIGSKGIVTAAMEIEKKDLRTAALSAMAALCGGPISIVTDSKVNHQFDVRRMLSWIETIFETVSDRTHAIGRRALKNLIVHNREHSYLLDRSIEMCYLAKSSKALESYFEVVTEVLTEREDIFLPFWKVISAGLYTLGHENNALRIKSARLLRTLEERQQKSSKLQDLDISISDKTIAVYKLAQFEASRRLAKQHSELAFHVFSQFSYYFRELQPDHQRNMVAAMLPWVQTVELQIDPNGGPTATSYMLLVNLFEITIRCGNALHNEIQALWQSLATGPYAGNVQLILDFIISLCLEKREQNFVDFTKQIVVYLSSTPAGLKVVEFLLLQVNPRAMAPEKKETRPPPPEASTLPYLADLGAILPSSSKQSSFSLGQLCLILLVDLMVSPIQLSKDHVPLLLQVVLVLWDHYTPVVQDQAREMLVHLIHELVIANIDEADTIPDKRTVEDFIESVRRHDSKVVWGYEDENGKENDGSGIRVPESMAYVAEEVVKIFSITYPGIREDWGKVTLSWATSCPVRHLACRSFQLFRCILSTLDQRMLADMLARLSNTISDEESDIQTFSMEILTTLRTVIEALQPADLIQYPQLFWTTCACLDTVHEREFMESLAMLDKLLDKINLSDPAMVKLLKECCPQRWDGEFEGLASLIYKGIRSSICLERSSKILERLAVLPVNELVGDQTQLLFVILANTPRFLVSYEQEPTDQSVSITADLLAGVAEDQNYAGLARVLRSFATQRYRADKDFLSQLISAIRTTFFPSLEYRCLVFLMGLLTNKLPWFKIKAMQILCAIIPDIDMRKQEIAGKGPDLMSPLLRLLQTEFCPQALQVLDNVMTMSGAPTPLDKHHLRMSMAGSHSSKAFRKEYEKVQSLYGIPEESGWSIPMPADHSSKTRNNVHAVFYTCVTTENPGLSDTPTPKVEFRAEEFHFPPFIDYRTPTMTSEEVRGDGHIGELVMKLDSLDDFFEDDVEDTIRMPVSPSRYTNTSMDARENVYDQQTLPILHQSLTRNISISSFQTSFADLKGLDLRDPGVMTPTAFTVPSAASSGIPSTTITPVTSAGPLMTTVPLRGGLHARSITSPSVNQRSPKNTQATVDEIDEPFSDDDVSAGRTHASERPFFLESMMRPLAQTRSGFRSGMRRLTGGSGDVKERERTRDAIRGALQRSPQVPKVPDMYLQQNPKSADP